MKIKKSEYKKRISNAYKIGLRAGLYNPAFARLYLSNEHMERTLNAIAETMDDLFSKVEGNSRNVEDEKNE